MALSNSGETAELADLIGHCIRFGLPLVGITGRAGSTLAKAARVALVLPEAREACPMGLAPTTSTTMQIALGDALAVALLTRRGFGAADFRQFHPGGRLGARLRLVRDLMHGAAELPLAREGSAVGDALPVMTARRFGCVGILDAEGRLSGIITDGDLRRALGPGLLEAAVETVMSRAPRVIAPDALAAEALHVMNTPERPITALFVIDPDGRPLGLLHMHDLLRAGMA